MMAIREVENDNPGRGSVFLLNLSRPRGMVPVAVRRCGRDARAALDAAGADRARDTVGGGGRRGEPAKKPGDSA